jgi:probable H4MPT-linked C1 transfer pathway protein
VEVEARQSRPQGLEVDQARPDVQEQQVIGLDIGGAALKAFAAGRAFSHRFPLWKHPELLADALCDLLAPVSNSGAARIAVTMTGELCDCFPTKADGVHAILDSLARAFPTADVQIWQTDDCFLSVDDAKRRVLETAASNFLALAWIVAQEFPSRRTLLVDVGSTTIDLIPIIDGRPAPRGRTDRDRLESGELIYQGVERTPVCALVRELTIDGVRHHVMNELFATTLDVYLTTGDLPENPSETMTADGRPATVEYARSRLARMVGADRTTFNAADAKEVAKQVASAQQEALRLALGAAARWNDEPFDLVVLAGQGEWLARRVLNDVSALANVKIASFSDRVGKDVSRCACAYAVARLAAACFANGRR